jgi:predicted ATPase
MYLTEMRRREETRREPGRFPWLPPLVGDIEGIVLERPVTFLVGENGSGKSTLLALPGAAILQMEGGRLESVAWNDLEHVRVTRAFLTNPAAVLRQVLE